MWLDWNSLRRELANVSTDERTKDWFMMPSAYPTNLLVAGYIIFVTILGPKLMEKRNAFQLKTVIVYYNFFQVCFSSYIFYEVS